MSELENSAKSLKSLLENYRDLDSRIAKSSTAHVKRKLETRLRKVKKYISIEAIRFQEIIKEGTKRT
jgi:uncharacterized membrane-anchored protein YhcB (DUF1043 family)